MKDIIDWVSSPDGQRFMDDCERTLRRGCKLNEDRELRDLLEIVFNAGASSNESK